MIVDKGRRKILLNNSSLGSRTTGYKKGQIQPKPGRNCLLTLCTILVSKYNFNCKLRFSVGHRKYPGEDDTDSAIARLLTL